MFWASWKDGSIAVGRGAQVGQDVLVQWTDPSPHPVVQLHVTTGDDTPGLWEILSAESRLHSVRSCV